MPTPKQDYVATLNAIAARYGTMEDATIRAILTELDETRRQVNASLADINTAYGALAARQQLANIEVLITELEARMTATAQDSTKKAYVAGGESAVLPLQKIGFQSVFFSPNIAQLNTLVDFTPALIKGITEPLRAVVARQVSQVALGQATPFQAMQAVTAAFGKSEVRQGKMVASGVSAKAEMDMRTELQRVYNLSNYAQQQDLARTLTGLLKTWIANGDRRTRKSHLRAHLEYHTNPIPVGSMFKLYTQGKGTSELRYPVDPLGAIWETAGCRCRMATVIKEIGPIGSSLDGRIQAEVNRREKK